ncbi:MAG: tetraacyldisaccharide 4'-kinase [Legionellales bacterium]|jgi:tetraacyldisaccharide 4'-kinase
MFKIYHYFLYAWYQYPWAFILLLPASIVYQIIISIRRFLYQKNYFKKYRASVPVIVVGNFVVGGTGKTPMVIAIAKLLLQAGFKPGIITRGYRSDNAAQNLLIDKNSDPTLAGDEPVLIATQTGCPVVKNKNRAAGAAILAKQCDIIISDDGLQHYGLIADIKIAMQPDKIWLKNNFLLPAGPWRESKNLLKTVDFTVESQVEIEDIYPLNAENKARHDGPVHAVCAIAAPWRFFKLLNDFGIKTINHAYPDHYLLTENNLKFEDALPIFITEKDAVKCKNFNLANVWVVRIKTKLDPVFTTSLLNKISSLRISS